MNRCVKRRAHRAELTISSKRQVTLPAAMIRELEVEPGDKLVARLENDTILIQRRPKSLIEYLDSFPKGVYGRTKEEIDAYIVAGRSDRDLSLLEMDESTTQ